MMIFIENDNVRLIDRLKSALAQSKEAKIAVSYIRSSGINSVYAHFEDFVKRGGDLQIITSAQLGITEKEAVLSLLEINASVMVFKKSQEKTFHSKAFIFKGDEFSSIIIGSSNLTRSGLLSGIEWNLEIETTDSIAAEIEESFDHLWVSDSTERVTKDNIDSLIYDLPDDKIRILIEQEDGVRATPVQTLTKLENSSVYYPVHKRPDRYATWNFNLSVSKINRLSRQGDFFVVFHCNYESSDEVIFAIPSSFLNDHIFPYAHQTRDGRYMINVNKTTYQFNWQRSIKMDSRPFIIEKSLTPGSDDDY